MNDFLQTLPAIALAILIAGIYRSLIWYSDPRRKLVCYYQPQPILDKFTVDRCWVELKDSESNDPWHETFKRCDSHFFTKISVCNHLGLEIAFREKHGPWVILIPWQDVEITETHADPHDGIKYILRFAKAPSVGIRISEEAMDELNRLGAHWKQREMPRRGLGSPQT